MKKHTYLLIILLLCLVVGRGIILLCVLPPFEGWDEYQHIAYIQYLVENNQQPVLSESNVSRSLISQAIQYPQPKSMVEQLRSAGALDYQAFYQSPEPPQYIDDHPDILLYQAQHGKLYYSLVEPVFILTGGLNNLIHGVYTLRLMNFLFVWIALSMIFLSLGKIANIDKPGLFLIMVLIASQPLYLINAARVSNDALAVLFGTIPILWALRPDLHQKRWLSILTGIALGLGVWAKSTNISLWLFILLSLSVDVLMKKNSIKSALVNFAIVSITAVVVSLPNTVFNIVQYGSIAPMQENILQQNSSNSLQALFTFVSQSNWLEELIRQWLRYSTWVGGWSFLRVYKGEQIVAWMIVIALVGGLISLLFRPQSKSNQPIALKCTLLIISVSLGLVWHMYQSYNAWGRLTTNPWYASIAFPFALLLAFLSARSIHRLAGMIFAILVSGLYLAIEGAGIWTKMLPTYSGGEIGMKALQIIAAYHPPWLGTTTLLIALALVAFILIMLIVFWFRFARMDTN